MSRRRVAETGSRGWAVVGLVVALAALPGVNGDARALVASASVVFPLCALGAAWALGRRHDRAAGVLLLLSVATPTYFAYPLNVPALVVGVALVVSPSVALGERGAAAAASRRGAG